MLPGGYCTLAGTGFDLLVPPLKICITKRLPVFESDVRLLLIAMPGVWREAGERAWGIFFFVINNNQVTELNVPLLK